MDEVVGEDEVRAATGGWWLLLLVGLISVIAGILIIAKPGDSLTTLAVIAGIFLLADGIIELAAALMHGTQSRGMVALLGAVTAIAGVLLIRHPIGGVVAVALLIGIWLITVGVVRFIAAFDFEANRGWNMGVGLIEVIAGIVIVANPNIGFATLAVLVGIAFIVNGLAMAALGWSLHKIRSAGAAV
jgi:uncharacterized membrane protein HdeD (DUF308 family)